MVVRLEEMADNDQNGRRLSPIGHPNDPRLKVNTTNNDSAVPSSRNSIRDNYQYIHEWDSNILRNSTHQFSHDQTQQSATHFPQTSTERNSVYAVSNTAERSMNGIINQCDPSAPLPQSPVNFAASATTHSRSMIHATRNVNMGLNVSPSPMVLMPPPPPPPPIPRFDVSRPPPPLPAYIKENGKHKISAPVQAGPSKLKKSEYSKACDLCEKCVQRQIRIDMYKEEMERLLLEDEKQSLNYKKKMQGLEKGKLLIKSCVGEELYNFIEEYIEAVPDFFQSDDFLTQCHYATSSVSSSRQILLQLLMKMMARNIGESSLSLEDSLLDALSLQSRRASLLEAPPPAPARDLLQEIAAALASAAPPVPASAAPTAPAPLPTPTSNPAPTAKPAPAVYVSDWARGPPPGFPAPGIPPPPYNNAPPPPMRYPPHSHFPYYQ